MNTHPYLRAYMAGVAVPSLVLLLVVTAYFLARFVYQVAIPIERAIVFPMALVPSLFGVWNMFYLWLRPRRHLPIGLHGALLPFVLAPIGVMLATALGFLHLGPDSAIWFEHFAIPYHEVAIAFGIGLMVYYLVWKYLVAFLNQVIGIG
ncbi:MAG: hypothetical protein ACRD3L_18770 [Terriglobales bacterium]